MPMDLPADAPASAPTAAIVAPAATAETIFADGVGYRFSVSGNTLLPPQVVRAAIEKAQSPKEALDFLNMEYQRRGFFLVAIRGEVRDKLVAMVVVEGRITESNVTPSLAAFYRGVENDPAIDRNTLIRRSALAEIYSGRQGMRPKVQFESAKEFGGARMNVTEEPIPGAKPWNAGLMFGNLGSRYSSRYTASANGAVRPGGGLELSAGYTQGLPGLTADSAGSQYQNFVAGASIVTPWGMYGANFNGVAYKNGEASAPLYPDGDINTTTVSGTQLVWATETMRIAVNESWVHTDNTVTVFDNSFTLTDQHYDVLNAGILYSDAFAFLGQNASLSAGLTGSFGISPPKGTFLPVSQGVPNTRFAMAQANVNYNQSLPYGMTLQAAISGQYADSTVPQNQQWVLGGFGNLTAWLPAILVGDSGALGRVTVNAPAYAWEGYSVSANAFVEGGLTRLHYTPADNPKTKSLWDAGLSLSAATPFGTTLALAYAWPFASRNIALSAANSQGRANLYFTLSQAF